MTISNRIKWLLEAFKTLLLAWRKVKPVVNALPASTGKGDIMTTVSIENLKAAQAYLNTNPQAKAILAAAQSLAGGDGAKFIAAFKAHDWGTVATTAITDALTIANAAGVPFTGLALKLLPVGIYMAKHPHNSGEGGIGAAPEGPPTNNIVI